MAKRAAWRKKNAKILRIKARDYYRRLSKNPQIMKKKRKQNQEYSERLKLKVFNHYCKGRIKCQCKRCPIRHPNLLTLDHKISAENALARRHQGGAKLYRLLIKKNFPKSFQILCASCNLAKGAKKHCPRYGKTH